MGRKKESAKEAEAQKLMSTIGVSEADLVSMVSTDYNESIEMTREKRKTFERRQKLYLGIKDQEEKIYVRLVYSVMDTLLALEHSDERSVIFNGRKIGSDDYADNINNVAKYDFEQMGCEKKKYQVRRDKLFYGPGIEVMDGWDKTLHCPTYKVISPAVWCPDWYTDVNHGPRYHGFEYEVTREELEGDDTFFDVDKAMTTEQMDDMLYQEKQSVYDQRGISNTIGNCSSDVLGIYYHYRRIKGRPYVIVLANRQSKVIKFEEIPAMTDIEKEDPTKIQMPVIVRHYRKLRYDPFGVCLPDLLEDKEAMQQLFINLGAIKAKHEALGDMFLFDPDKIDVNNITIPAVGPKYVPVTGLGAMQGGAVPMMEVPKGNIKPDTFNMSDVVRNEGTFAIGMDNQTLGVQGATNITATENQRVQGNSNLRLMLGIKFDNEAEKDFWGRWYKFYCYYFDSGKEKNFVLNDSVGSIYYSVQKKDFGGLTDIDIQIKSKSDLEAIREKEKAGFMVAVQGVLTDPTAKPSQRSFAMREMLRINGVPQEKINRLVEMPPEERKATEHIALLNKNEMPPKITDMNEDHRTYIAIYDRAFNTDAKWKAIQRRKLALDMSGQSSPQAMQAPQQPQGGQMGGMLINDMMQQGNKVQNGAKSLQSIAN